jgi:hypothetical protein
MKQKLFCLFLFITFYWLSVHSQQHDTTKKVFKIGVFAPLYLDSVFLGDKLRNNKAIPKLVSPALEFVQGAQIAFDKLTLNEENVHAYIYDTKSFTQPLPALIGSHILDTFNLLIGSVRDADFRQLADFAKETKVPFFSVTYPNDGGVTDNPYMTIINSTLKAHCEGIYSYILQNHGTDKIILCKKPGVQEDKIAAIFKALNEQDGKPPILNIEMINVDSTLSSFALRKKLDSTKTNIIIGGSLDEKFAKSVADAGFANRKTYEVKLIGMPNWDGFKSFNKKDAYKDFGIHFTTPHYVEKNYYANIFTEAYKEEFSVRPSDMAYKGFQSAYYFTRLLTQYPKNMMEHLNEKKFTVLHEYNFKPVYLDNKTDNPDYYENKRLYVMRIMNGVVEREW